MPLSYSCASSPYCPPSYCCECEMHPGIYSDCKQTRATSDACSVKPIGETARSSHRARIKNPSGFYDSTRLMRASNWKSARVTTVRAHEHAQVRELRNGLSAVRNRVLRGALTGNYDHDCLRGSSPVINIPL